MTAAFWNKFKKGSKKNEQESSEKGSVSLIDKIVKKTKDEKKEAEGKEKKGSKKDKKAKKQETVVPREKAEFLEGIVKRPIISEDVMNKQALNKYVFIVDKKAGKKEIKSAVEIMYKVEVEKVNVVIYKARKRFFRGKKGYNGGYKKAFVTIKEGQSLDVFNELA